VKWPAKRFFLTFRPFGMKFVVRRAFRPLVGWFFRTSWPSSIACEERSYDSLFGLTHVRRRGIGRTTGMLWL
jgi:hypothetical protein